MNQSTPDDLVHFLSSIHPYDTLDEPGLGDLAATMDVRTYGADVPIYNAGERLDGLYVVKTGKVSVSHATGDIVSTLGPRNSFGERGLTRDGFAVTSARAVQPTTLLLLPAGRFHALLESNAAFSRFFTRGQDRRPEPRPSDLTTTRVDAIMTRNPITCTSDTPIVDAARMMRDRKVSSLCVTDADRLAGIVTVRDLAGRVVAEGHPTDGPITQVMTANPQTLPPSAIGSDVFHTMMERHIGHVPIAENGRLVGIVTQTDLTRLQAINSAHLVKDLTTAKNADDLAGVTGSIPRLLVQLVGAGNRHDVVTRLITDIADAATRRLLALAEEKLGPAPAPYLWLACGSQGRKEQTGVSDQDNCLIIEDSATDNDMAWFDQLATYVSDGLNRCGYVYCPGDMMATNPRWRQRVSTWRQYFTGWINRPDTEAQMLASVMFDLRPIGGRHALYEDLQGEVLELASKNSIFVAHMISNSLKHAPPLGLLRGFATMRSGEHKNQIDMKHSGVVPIVDLGRVYALNGRLSVVNTRARLEAAREAGVVSEGGGRDLLDAYDLIAQSRIEHQARQIKMGEAPNNFMSPTVLSEFERSHLRDAFVVVRTMQSAAGQGKGAIG
ncbi:MAG: DUF294 nucleotidyltransferase-like domain-containing protein [Pseudomonadota bacterium]